MASDDITTLFDDGEFIGFDLGEPSTIGTDADAEQLEVRESRGKFYPQRLERQSTGEIEKKQTIGKSTRDRGRAERLLTGALDIDEPERSDRALAIDRSLAAPIADSWSDYQTNPDELDWPGIDTKL